MKDLTDLSPAEVDAKLFPILDALAHKDSSLANYRWLLGEVGRVHVGSRSFSGNRVGADGLEYHDPGVQRRQFEEGKAEVEAAIADLEAEAAPYETEFERRGGWTRYLVVPGGHLHYRSCHTLTPGRTMVGQTAEASGLDQAEVVGKFGVTACTHCFPDAPVEPKKTPAEEGFCTHSGEYVADRLVETGKLTPNWFNRYVSPTVPCECGWRGAITKGGKLRRHRAPA